MGLWYLKSGNGKVVVGFAIECYLIKPWTGGLEVTICDGLSGPMFGCFLEASEERCQLMCILKWILPASC